MKTYSVSEAADILDVNRSTLQRWVRNGFITAPAATIADGKLVKSWTEKDIAAIREFKRNSYRGKGMDRRKGNRAEQNKRGRK
jgi:excisionase family DNA binding protein